MKEKEKEPFIHITSITKLLLCDDYLTMKPAISTHSITSTNAGVIDAHVFEPLGLPGSSSTSIRGTIVTVHPWSTLGGGEHNTIGLARCITGTKPEHSNNNNSWRVITFTLKSNPFWTGGAVWGIFSNHSYEVQQIVDVVNWARETYAMGDFVLLGSSAGAPMAGTAMAQLLKQQETELQYDWNTVSAYIAIGYTFGNFASLGFGRHYSPLVTSSLPKLFIMGERDEFTSVHQLEQTAQKMRANNSDDIVDVEIVADVGHFELESPGHDPMVANMVLDWLDKILQ